MDVLIAAYEQVARRNPAWRLVIAGSGKLEPAFRRQADRLTADHVEFLGTIRDPVALLRRAGVFALASRFEGFPNALLNAMTSGCPVVATGCRTGQRELIHDRVPVK